VSFLRVRDRYPATITYFNLKKCRFAPLFFCPLVRNCLGDSIKIPDSDPIVVFQATFYKYLIFIFLWNLKIGENAFPLIIFVFLGLSAYIEVIIGYLL